MSKADRIITECVWQRIDSSGHDAFRLESRGADWALVGTAIGMEGPSPYAIEYEVLCDTDWKVIEGHARGWFKGSKLGVNLALVEGGHWLGGGTELEQLLGCNDLDFGFTPATNTIAIRRMDLAIGQEGHSTSAWLPFPELRMDRLDQYYKRTAESTYEYRVPEIGFRAELIVDQEQVIVDYPGLWTRVGTVP